MPTRKPRDPNEKPQIERFRDMARELECDEDEEAFKAKLAVIAKAKVGNYAPASPPKPSAKLKG